MEQITAQVPSGRRVVAFRELSIKIERRPGERRCIFGKLMRAKKILGDELAMTTCVRDQYTGVFGKKEIRLVHVFLGIVTVGLMVARLALLALLLC